MNKKRKLTDFFASSESETGKKKASTSTNTNESTNSTLNQRQQQPEAGDISAYKPFHPLETDQFPKKNTVPENEASKLTGEKSFLGYTMIKSK